MKVITRTDTIDHEEWLEARGKGIGGSDAGTILGTNPYKSRMQLWLEKTGRVEDPFNGNEATRLGQAFERPIAEIYAKQIAEEGLAVVAWPVLLQGNNEFQLANVDFLICRVSDLNAHEFELGKVNDYYGQDFPIGTTEILEIKTTGLSGRGNAAAWNDGQIPPAYKSQICHYAAVTGLWDARVVCLIGGQGIVERRVQFTTGDVVALTTAELEFWNQVTTDTEPAATGDDLDALKTLYPESTEETVEGDEMVADLVREYVAAKEALDQQEAELKNLRAQLEQLIGSASAVTFDGQTLYTYKSTKAGETFDAKAFKEAHPELAAQFTKTKPGYRLLKVTK